MKLYKAISKEVNHIYVTGDTLEESDGEWYISDSVFGTRNSVIVASLEVEEIERDKDGNIVYSGPEREDPNRIDITAREYVSEQFDKPPLSQDSYLDEHDLGASTERRKDFEDFDDPLKKLLNE